MQTTVALDQRFLDAYHKFLTRYVTSAAAQQYAAQVTQARREAIFAYRAIADAASRGEDVTDAVLTQLLPHADTATNRARNAWIHNSAVLSGDVRQLHEQLGWARPEQWTQKAAAILDFVRTCVEDPAELAAACLRFHQHPLTIGFQSGALSPILNALRPDDFAIMHSKSLRVVNFFGHRRVSADLTDYPAANAAALQLVQRIADVGGVPPELELAPVDRFDLFYYDLEDRSKELIRLTHMPFADERQPVAIDSSHFSYLSDQNGVYNREKGYHSDECIPPDTLSPGCK
ncbi:MAG: hypothetical protein KDD84_16605, partial [Caldilineaceae bacterium]|nr:hypothetical protein [Caldilineaceae bacterium]